MHFKFPGGVKAIVIQVSNLCWSHLIVQYEKKNLIYDRTELNFYVVMETCCSFLSQYALILHIYIHFIEHVGEFYHF